MKVPKHDPTAYRFTHCIQCSRERPSNEKGWKIWRDKQVDNPISGPIVIHGATACPECHKANQEELERLITEDIRLKEEKE